MPQGRPENFPACHVPQARRAVHAAGQHAVTHPSVALGYNNLAYNCYCQGRHAAADPLYQRALSLHRRSRRQAGKAKP
jgi:hypothetical protein